ncbi:MAG: endolytic transglycosylase MltG [Alphaproteobacteria bacterium]|nr:endolytic transglycosylase MltG [Alphaproteobacteria bacterium]
MRRMILITGIILVVAMLSVVGLFGAVYRYMSTPSHLVVEKVIIIPKKSSVHTIVQQLGDNGILDNPFLFRLGLKLYYRNITFQAGEYQFPKTVSPKEVIRRLSRGERVIRKFTVPEGYTTYQVLEKLHKTEGLLGYIESSAPLLEGTLLPETYLFSYGDEKQMIITQMQNRFNDVLNDLWEKRGHNLPFNSKEEAVVLASLVEKETSRPEERPLIAGVFINRLRKGIPLQTDPTIIYALSQGKGYIERSLARSDWKFDSPYNTYQHAGLPPGPINNPGRASIEAALHPFETDAIFFVSDGQGAHHFSKTLAEHNQYVKELQAMRKENRKLKEAQGK